MSSFNEFMNKAKNSPEQVFPTSNTSLSIVESFLSSTIGNLLSPFAISSDKKQEFSEEVSNLVRDEKFVSKFSDRIGVPSDLETEDEFVERSCTVLREMLYAKFGIKA